MAFTTHWRGQADTSRSLVVSLVLSVLVHLPMSPLVVLLGLTGLLLDAPPDPAPAEELNAIPIDLLAESEEPPEPGVIEAPPLPADPAPSAIEEPAMAVADAGVVDADAADANTEDADAEDAGAEDADAEDADTDTSDEPDADARELADLDAGDGGPSDADLADAADAADADAAGVGDAGPPPPRLRNPVALAAKQAKVVDSNAAVAITVYSENIRRHPLGPRLGHLLGHLPQWQDFFGPAGLDPIASIDRILLVGPDLRDSSGLAVLIQHRLPAPKIRGAIDALVKRSRGSWLDGPVPAALARADRADRIFVLPSAKMVVIAPLSARESALGFPPTATVPKPQGTEAVFGTLKTPGYAFEKHGAPLHIPASVEYLEFWVTPTDDGGGVGRFVLKDSSPEAAAQTFTSVKNQLDTLRVAGSFAGLGASLFQGKGSGLDPEDLKLVVAVLAGLELSVHGSEVHGTVVGSRPLVEAIIAQIERQFRVPRAGSTRPPKPRPSATTPSITPGRPPEPPRPATPVPSAG